MKPVYSLMLSSSLFLGAAGQLAAAAQLGNLANPTAKDATAGKAVQFTVYDRPYFVKNTFEPNAAESFAVLKSLTDFENVFGVGMVMRGPRPQVNDAMFRSQWIATVVKRGPMCRYTVDSVAAKGNRLEVRFTAKTDPPGTATFAVPLILGVPKGDYASVTFFENGKEVKTIRLMKQPSAAPSQPAHDNPATAANNDFAADLYRQMAKENAGKNLFFSPYSMLSALAMTAEGARGETAAQMGKVLCFPDSARQAGNQSLPWNITVIHTGMAALNERFNPKPASPEVRNKIETLRKELAASQQRLDELQKSNNWQKYSEEARKSQSLVERLNPLLTQVDQYELRVANALWAEKSFPLSADYLDTLHKYYSTGGAFPADFKNNAESERQRINAWVEEQTNQKIRDLMPQGSINALTRLVLTNAIYFKGEWAQPFSADATKEEDFLAVGSKVRVPMMHKDALEGARYAAFNGDGSLFVTPATISFGQQPDPKTLYPGQGGYLVAELPYKGGDLSMVAIVPQDADGLAALESKLSGATLHAWIGKLQGREINVELPRFKLETEYPMNDTLKALGMVRAFNPPGASDGAQFDGMCASQAPQDKLCIAIVMHKAFVEVNEKGTEAAAATGIAMAGMAAPVSVPFVPSFRADRPFMFFIRDVKTGTILFFGRVTTPNG